MNLELVLTFEQLLAVFVCTPSQAVFLPVYLAVRAGVYMYMCLECTDTLLHLGCGPTSSTPAGSSRLVADGLWLLVLVVSVLGLELLDERDVLLLGLLLGDVLVDLLLPGVLLCLALRAG